MLDYWNFDRVSIADKNNKFVSLIVREGGDGNSNDIMLNATIKLTNIIKLI